MDATLGDHCRRWRSPRAVGRRHGRTVVGVLVVGWTGSEQHAAAIAPLKDLGPLVQFVTPMPYTALQQMLDDSLPWGISAYEKGLNLDDLPDGAIDAVLEWLPRRTSPLSQVPMFALGGRFAEIADDATAFSGSRSLRWSLSVVGVTPDRESLVAEREWARGFWQALRPFARSDGAYINVLGEDDPDRVRASYGETKYRRLTALKAEWDPDNVFRHNANIPPTAAPVPVPRAPEPEAAALPTT